MESGREFCRRSDPPQAEKLTSEPLSQGPKGTVCVLGGVRAAVFPYSIVIKTEAVRAMPGLCIFKHDSIAVIGLAADNCKAVIIFPIYFQVSFINLCHFFDSHNALAVYNRHMQRFF